MNAIALLAALFIALLPAAGLAASTSANQAQEELKELRARIAAMQKKLAAAEETRNETADALRESEQAISEANRELRELAAQSRESGARLNVLRKSARAAGARLDTQQELISRMLRRQYQQGEPDALRLVLAGENPNELARQLHYLSYIAKARAGLVRDLRSNLAELEQFQQAIAGEVAEIARITAEQTAQKKRLEQEKLARAKTLKRVSGEIRTQQQQILGLRNNENRLSRLIEQLAKIVRKPRAAAPGKSRPRNEVVPGDSGSARFAALRGLLALPVRGELGGRFGSPRAGGGITWKGLFIAAPGGEEVRAVAAGRVVYADWLRGFGNLLIIDHGENYLTLYANAESLLKRVGEAIRGGDPVATVGNSGGNVESGLYFEIRHEGKPFDPLPWVRLR